VGGSTAATLLANAVAPGVLDRYLARTGFKSQQADQPKPPDQPANLWQPADGPREPDQGAHGRFDDRATDRSVQLWASQHHGLLGAAAGAALAAVGAAIVRARHEVLAQPECAGQPLDRRGRIPIPQPWKYICHGADARRRPGHRLGKS